MISKRLVVGLLALSALSCAAANEQFKLLSREHRDGYMLERREFYPDADLAVETLVLIPNGATRAEGVVIMADRCASIECLAGEPDPYASSDPDNGRTAYFAVKAGCVAMALARPAEANGAPDDVNSADSVKKYRTLLPNSGWSDAKLVKTELEMCANYLKGLKAVDPAKVTTEPRRFARPADCTPVPKYGGKTLATGKRMMNAKDYQPERADGRTKKTMTWAMMKLRQANPPVPDPVIETKEKYLAWAKAKKDALRRAYEQMGVPENPEFTLLKSERRDGYTLKTYEFSPYEGYVVETKILVPDGARPGKTPVVICLPGTQGSLERLTGEPDPFRAGWPTHTLRARQAWWYAQVGMIGVALENIGNARSAAFDLDYAKSQYKARQLLGMLGGMSDLSFITKEIGMCINFLKKDPLVDRKKIAVSGHSLGAIVIDAAVRNPDIAACIYNDFMCSGVARRISITNLPSGLSETGSGCITPAMVIAPKPCLFNEGGAWKNLLSDIKKTYEYAGNPEGFGLHFYDKYANPDDRKYDDIDSRSVTGLDSAGFSAHNNCDPADHSFHAESALPWICRLFYGKWEPSAKLQAEIARAHAEKKRKIEEFFPPDGMKGRLCAPRRRDFIESDWIPERPDGRTSKTMVWAAMQLEKKGIPFDKHVLW